MIHSSNSQAVHLLKQKAQHRAPRNLPRRLRETRAALAVQEGNSDADWQPWEDSMVSFESQFQSMGDQFAHVEAFASIYQER